MRTALWFAHLAALTLAVAALAPHEPAEAAAAPEPEFAVWSGSSLIVFSAYGSRGGTYAIRPDGGGLRRLTTAGETQPVVSPDGRTLLLSSDGSLVTIGIDGGGKRALGKGFAAAWSPDGRRIAFNRNDGVYLMRADGTGAHKLVTNRYAYYAPAWSPDGKKVAYVACSAPHGSVPCEHQSGFDVYVIGVDGTGKHRVTPRSGYPQCPAWSSAGKLAFHPAHNTVAIVQRGGGLRTFRPGACPVWAPSGRRVAVATATGAALLNADGSSRKRIAVVPGSHSTFLSIAWSQDGRSLALVGGTDVGRNHLYVVRSDGHGRRRLL